MRNVGGLFLAILLIVAVGCAESKPKAERKTQVDTASIIVEAPRVKDSTPVEVGLPTPTPTPEYTEVEIGMSFIDFTLLCRSAGEQVPKPKSYNTMKTASGKATWIELAYSEERLRKGCVGSFMFQNNVLTSIYE